MTPRTSIADVAAQIGSVLLPDNDGWVNRFQINSTSSSARYTIAQRRSDGVWGCSCQGWRTHRRCKHVRDVLQRLGRVVVKKEYDDGAVKVLLSARTAHLDLEARPIKLAVPAPRARVLDLD